MMKDLLKELIPMFRTEQCCFIYSDDGEHLICLGRTDDLTDEELEQVEAVMDVSSLGWLYFRVFMTFRLDTMENIR